MCVCVHVLVCMCCTLSPVWACVRTCVRACACNLSVIISWLAHPHKGGQERECGVVTWRGVACVVWRGVVWRDVIWCAAARCGAMQCVVVSVINENLSISTHRRPVDRVNDP